MNNTLRKLLTPFASLRLTVVLMALAMIVVFAGTLAQRTAGIWDVQKTYFHSFFLWFDLAKWFPALAGEAQRSVHVPYMLGGYSLIALLLVNLLAAHTVRFKLAWRRAGILLIHAGLIFLILGEVVTSVAQVEGQMMIDEGQTVNFTMNMRRPELAILDPSPADHDNVVVIPMSKLKPGETVRDEKLPFAVRIDAFYANSEPELASRSKQKVRATTGPGTMIAVEPAPPVPGAANGLDQPSVYITPIDADGRPLDTFLLSTMQLREDLPPIDQPQEVTVGGKTYRVQLRWTRKYKPYAITLIDFTHDRYQGTEVPKDFSSRIRLVNPSRGDDREAKIWMNNPLRYAGETFYQQSFLPGDRTTILQVVRNPGWVVPYAACAAITLGMIVHFGAYLLTFLARGPATPPVKTVSSRPDRYTLQPATGGLIWPAVAVALCLIYVAAAGRPPRIAGPFDLLAFGRIPISHDGRTQPLDSVARNSLRVISGKSTLRTEDGKRKSAVEWLADVMAAPDRAAEYKVFRIDYPDLVSLLKLDSKRKMFSVNDIRAEERALVAQFARLPRERRDRDPFQRALGDLRDHINLFNRLSMVDSLLVAPPATGGENWKTFAQAAQEAGPDLQRPNPGLAAFATLRHGYHHDQPDTFNESADRYLAYLSRAHPKLRQRADLEVLFNHFEPFYNAMVLYVGVFVLTALSWLGGSGSRWRAILQRTGFWVLCFTLAFHTLGLVARIYLSGRPPVTNLYSSAIVIGWAVAAFCAALELFYRNGVASLVGAVIAFPSLVIAHHLANTGDTMAMMQAVLDTNFWLATHVPVVVLGYAATFLAGTLGCAYVFTATFTSALENDDTLGKAFYRMVYGIICFAMLFSFVGTVLGGIWADQSWGRFWGWDPKENGAVMIVLWNAIVLHARWGGLVRERGFMTLAIFGNAVTAWSWFGTNMLGIGLHSYGFMDSAAFWLISFVALQLVVIGIGCLPVRSVRSVRSNPA